MNTALFLVKRVHSSLLFFSEDNLYFKSQMKNKEGGEINLSSLVKTYSAIMQVTFIAINTNMYYSLLHTVVRTLFMCYHRLLTTILPNRHP